MKWQNKKGQSFLEIEIFGEIAIIPKSEKSNYLTMVNTKIRLINQILQTERVMRKLHLMRIGFILMGTGLFSVFNDFILVIYFCWIYCFWIHFYLRMGNSKSQNEYLALRL